MKQKWMKACCVFVVTAMIGICAGGAYADEPLIRGEVEINHGPNIHFSIPICLLEAVKTSGLSAMIEDKEELCNRIDALVEDLVSMKDKELLILNVNDEVEARIWVDEADDDPTEANFVMVDIDPANEHEPEVRLRLPKGIFFLGAFIGNQLMETHGKEFMELVRKQIIKEHFPSIPEPPHKWEKEHSKTHPSPAPINPEEIRREILKNVNPEKIRREIIDSIMKEIQKKH